MCVPPLYRVLPVRAVRLRGMFASLYHSLGLLLILAVLSFHPGRRLPFQPIDCSLGWRRCPHTEQPFGESRAHPLPLSSSLFLPIRVSGPGEARSQHHLDRYSFRRALFPYTPTLSPSSISPSAICHQRVSFSRWPIFSLSFSPRALIDFILVVFTQLSLRNSDP